MGEIEPRGRGDIGEPLRTGRGGDRGWSLLAAGYEDDPADNKNEALKIVNLTDSDVKNCTNSRY